jgi:hypothetical protein
MQNYKKKILLNLNTISQNNINLVLSQYSININEFKKKYSELSEFIDRDINIQINLLLFGNSKFELELRGLHLKVLISLLKNLEKINLLDILKITLVLNKFNLLNLRLNILNIKSFIKCNKIKQ